MTKKETEFLRESNKIDHNYNPVVWPSREDYDKVALSDAMKAWEYAKTFEEMSIIAILEIHEELMTHIYPEVAGKFRNFDVWIGAEKRPFVSESVFGSELMDVCALMNSANPKDHTEEMCRHTHVLFERIHPFGDGNGRTGRILYNWHRLRIGLPIHIIHTGAEQMEYYKWFNS